MSISPLQYLGRSLLRLTAIAIIRITQPFFLSLPIKAITTQPTPTTRRKRADAAAHVILSYARRRNSIITSSDQHRLLLPLRTPSYHPNPYTNHHHSNLSRTFNTTKNLLKYQSIRGRILSTPSLSSSQLLASEKSGTKLRVETSWGKRGCSCGRRWKTIFP
ncbi:hypothetical protein GQ43DRAFT_96606 [Delitschia confertaspora ATCC 74209]|uniref:Uncharacterized protein n=1 Tax=Delitschia confertaspora ATCC 74209 TaxID=1513339 RepID=A0A9P4JIF7_9PLEO|nr:hypothetical protein GQ43DRAFT_96606 [Delitschia confertaspora ATCC 74209]